MNDGFDQRFFSLSEYYLSDIEFFAGCVLTKREKLINRVIHSAGVTGFIVAYVIMIMRKTTVNLPIFRDVAILDIKGNWVLRKQVIAAEHRNLPMQRRHLPSLRILQEIIKAYTRYRQRVHGYRIESGRESSNPDGSTTFITSCAKMKHLSICPTSNRLYLFWLLHFYIHRSIIFANSQEILSNVKSVVTIEEYTPQIAGYLSALSDLGLPLTLYSPLKLAFPEITLKSLSMFAQVIVRNGSDVDFIKAHHRGPVYLEKRLNKAINFDTRIAPRIGVFLSSYYTLESQQLTHWIIESIIPFLNKLQNDWGAASIVVSCHPNDIRSKKILAESNIHVSAPDVAKEKRMLDYDVVFCGNTSVVEEALDEGIPVVYTGAMDTYAHDLYGYVRSGLVLDATYSLPARNEVRIFYDRIENQNKCQQLINDNCQHERVDLVDAICFVKSADVSQISESS